MREDLPQCILLLPRCSPEDLNAINEDRGSLTPLQISCSLGNIVITQLLIWVWSFGIFLRPYLRVANISSLYGNHFVIFLLQYFADVRILDGKGRSALWHAKSAGSKECADILRHNGCNDLGTMIPQVYDVFM